MVAVVCSIVASSAATFSLKNVAALIIGLLIGLPIAANMVSYLNAKHAHDHEPQIVRDWR
jgi:hypothetical protein